MLITRKAIRYAEKKGACYEALSWLYSRHGITTEELVEYNPSWDIYVSQGPPALLRMLDKTIKDRRLNKE